MNEFKYIWLPIPDELPVYSLQAGGSPEYLDGVGTKQIQT